MEERKDHFMNEDKDKRFAVLIDADNVSARYIKPILDELSNDGIITYKRIYGDWTKTEMNPWKNVLLSHSITPMQQYSYTTGKNATDSAMIIDAMDILYSGNVDGFCIVSSDSDFTRLAVRLRESGMYVIGMGEKKTPAPFISACNRFLYLEVLSGEGSKEKGAGGELTAEVIKEAFATILTEISDEDGWASLSQAGNILTKRSPSSEGRSFGFMKLTPFIKSLGAFEIYSVPSENGNVRVVYVRNR